MTGKRFSKTICAGSVFLSVLSGTAAPIRQAALPRVDREGFYAIDIPYEVAGVAKPDFSDLRIWSRNGREIAYFIREEEHYTEGKEFISCPIEVSVWPGRTDVFIRTGGQPLSSFVFRIKNADTDKTASLKGSDDREHWYTVKDRISFSREYDRSYTETQFTVEFPLSDYAYYLLSISDSLSAPLNVLSVGTIKEKPVSVKDRTGVLPASVWQKDEKSHTDLTLAFPGKFVFREIVFYVSSPLYYRRPVRMAIPSREKAVRQKRFSRRRTLVREEICRYDVLDSDRESRLYLDDGLYADTLKIRIENGDDQPLTVDSVRACIAHAVAVAWLNPEDTYVLTYGDEEARKPQYDLSFRKKVPVRLSSLTIENIRKLPAETPVSGLGVRFWKTYGIWLIIGLVMIQILFIVYRMISSRN